MAEGSVGVNSFFFSPDSAHVVYIADQDTNGKNELYATDTGQAPLLYLYLPLVVH